MKVESQWIIINTKYKDHTVREAHFLQVVFDCDRCEVPVELCSPVEALVSFFTGV